MAPPAVTIVILNWNGKKFLEQFLPSVLATRYANFEILLTDNASTDDSVAWVQAHHPAVRILQLDQNYGFTEGNNRALPHVHTPYYVLLNSDVEVDPDWLGPLVDYMERHPHVAIAQPRILAFHDRESLEYAGAAGGYLDWLGYPFCRGRLFDTLERDQPEFQDERLIFWATGACCIVRKAVTDRIGLFEPSFFAHMEEIDFCWRAQNYGYAAGYCGHSRVWHVGGGTLQRENPRKTFLNVRNSLAMLVRNFPMSQMPWKVFLRASLDGVWGIRSLLKGEWRTVWAILKGHWAVWLRLPFWIRRRRALYRDLPRIPAPKTGYMPLSIVWQYFGRGKKQFRDL